MHLLSRNDFSLGWQPGVDVTKGPKECFVRGDNIILDDQGLVSLRLGSHTLNPVDPVTGLVVPVRSNLTQVHSLHTVNVNGVRNRLIGATDEFGTTVAVRGLGWGATGSGSYGSFGSFDGTGDIAFGSFQGQLLATRGTTHWKNDGTNNRSWGIAGPQYAPICTVLPPRVLSIATFDTDDQPNWIIQAGEGTVTSGVGFDGMTDGALSVTPSSVTGRAAVQHYYSSSQDFNSFNGVDGALEDTFKIRVWISTPESLEGIMLMFDVNPASRAPFQDDYYYIELATLDASEVVLDNKEVLADKPDLTGPKRNKFLDDRDPDDRGAPLTRGRQEKPSSENAGWSTFTVLRGQMKRVGSTPGCDWTTVKAVQIVSQYAVPSGGGVLGSVKYDDFKILGGSDRTLTGKFRARFVWTRDFGNYVALSPPSPIGDEVECQNSAIIITQDSREAPDFQVLEPGGDTWGFLGGGTMTDFYRFNTANDDGGFLTVICTTSERDAIIADITLEDDLQTPPNNIIGIVGPHFNRMVLLTASKVYLTIEGNPDGCRASQVLDLADPSEVIKWGIKVDSAVLIGTTKDVYRLAGSLALLPDGETDARLDPMGVESPPISEFVVQDTALVVYLASDGFRMLVGGGSASINWNLDLMVLGYTRHGTSLNISPDSGRMSGGIFDGRLFLNIAGSNFVYVAELGKKYWRREQYPNGFARIHRELDGSIIAGDYAGQVWQLLTQDGGDKTALGVPAAIPVTYWTISDDDGQPLSYKEGFDWRAELDTGGAAATVALYLDESPAVSLAVTKTGYGTVQQTVGSALGVRSYKRVQMRISGAFNVFKMGSWGVTYRARALPMLYWDSSLLDFGTQDYVWLRELKFKGRAAVDLRVRIFFDGVLRSTSTLTVLPGVDTIYPVPIGPEVKGRLPLVIVEPVSGTTSPDSAFELYWMSARWKGTGGVTSKQFKLQPGAASAA